MHRKAPPIRTSARSPRGCPVCAPAPTQTHALDRALGTTLTHCGGFSASGGCMSEHSGAYVGAPSGVLRTYGS
eukprot:1412947-Prymnesium_polylepis.1